MAGPLTGVRVIDLTAVLLGPTATQVLGDFGADVIKVEPPAGDTTRGVGAARHVGMASLFLHINRNKRSVALDLKTEAGRQAMERLIRTADVLFFNMRPQALARLGFSYEAVARINPRIIYCGAFGYGQGGRHAERPAYDDLIQGATGLPELLARVSGAEPHYVPSALFDRMVALAAVNAVCAALYHRERTGEGQAIEVPMFETMAAMVLGEHMHGRTFDPPVGGTGYTRLLSPNRRPYRTRDGYLCAMIYTDRQWQRFFSFIGRPELIDDPRYVTLAARNQNIDELCGLAAVEYEKRTTDEWVAILDSLDIPAMKMNTLDTLLDDPHLADVGFLQWHEHPTEGRIRTIGDATRWSKTQGELRHLAPRHGEHTRELLRELGYTDDEIDALARAGVAGEPKAPQPARMTPGTPPPPTPRENSGR